MITLLKKFFSFFCWYNGKHSTKSRAVEKMVHTRLRPPMSADGFGGLESGRGFDE